MDVALTEEMETYVAEQVRAGRYGSAADLVEEALRQKMENDEAAYFRERIRMSEEDIKAGRFVVADDAYFERKRQRIRDLYMNADGPDDRL